MKLLVSVVDAAEATRALAGGAEIVDVKDPAEGALGAPAPATLSAVVAAVGDRAALSVALGDLGDTPHTAALAARAAVDLGAGYVKVGLRGVGSVDRACAMMAAVRDAVDGRAAVIAAGYADAREIGALDPACLPVVVGRTGIAGALIDTFAKDGRGLYGWWAAADVASLVAGVRAAGGTMALAGQLRLGELTAVDADLVGVRSAVCRDRDRGGELRVELVAEAVAAVRAGRVD